MAYNEYLAERVELFFVRKKVDFRSMKMMGGLCFMVDEKMCVGAIKEGLMARVGVENHESALQKKGCVPLDFTGRTMNGFVFLTDEATDLDEDLEYWLQLALDFNPLAKASPKKKKK